MGDASVSEGLAREQTSPFPTWRRKRRRPYERYEMRGPELSAWRRAVRIGQGELAEILGVHNRTVYAWEHGLQRIPPYLWRALLQIEGEIAAAATAAHAARGWYRGT